MRYPTIGMAGCYARAESGQAAKPPSAEMNSRLRMAPPWGLLPDCCATLDSIIARYNPRRPQRQASQADQHGASDHRGPSAEWHGHPDRTILSLSPGGRWHSSPNAPTEFQPHSGRHHWSRCWFTVLSDGADPLSPRLTRVVNQSWGAPFKLRGPVP